MVSLAATVPVDENGLVEVDKWLKQLDDQGFPDVENLLPKSLKLLEAVSHNDQKLKQRGIELANLVIGLQLDNHCAAAGLLYRCHREKLCSTEQIAAAVLPDVAELIDAVARMADSSLLEMSNSKMQSSEARDQVENIRRMLVSMIDDARVAILKLAERVIALRAAKSSSEERKRRIAQEALLIFAPLANRLGVWHLKWELEDLALRYLEPDVYKALAKQLDGRRAEREAQIDEIARSVQDRLRARGIDATVYGRAKHIFSIWKKMRSKNVSLKEVYDQRAIRIIVPDIGQCYSALGVVHTEWQHIPREFDDYIAVPKENGYRSIHTAVVGEDGKTLEVQIRTPEMHEESELGVCAHWRYKDGRLEDPTYTEKMNWLRRVVEQQEASREKGTTGSLGDELRHRIQEERIFVYTPKGHVLDLTTGATPVDFAYRIHTEVGHHCGGARVDGQTVALNRPLATGQRVEIITAPDAEPQRDWLENHLGYVATSRAREKIRDWFEARGDAANLDAGSELLRQVLGRLRLPVPEAESLRSLAEELDFKGPADFLIGLAVGDCQTLDVVAELAGERNAPAQLSLLPETRSRGREAFAIDVRARDREGLLLDITSFLKASAVSLVSNQGSVDEASGIARIVLDVRLASFVELAIVIDGLRQIPDVIDAGRVEDQFTRTGKTGIGPRI